MGKATALAVLVVLMAATGCRKAEEPNATDGDEARSNVAESAMAEAGAQASAAEGNISVGLLSAYDVGAVASELDFVDPRDSIHPYAACTFNTARSTCTSNVSTITWNGCTVGSATLTGGWTETYSAGFCADGAKPTALTGTASVTRTSTGQTLTAASRANITTDTNAHSAYDGTSIPATGVTISAGGGNRTVVIHGLRKVMKGPFGRTWFDHSITSPGMTVAGTRAAGTRVVTGTTTMYHNLARYTATHTFNNVTWGSASCCYPTSGTITSVLAGTRSGNTSMAFTSTCGQATFTDVDNTATSVTLTQGN